MYGAGACWVGWMDEGNEMDEGRAREDIGRGERGGREGGYQEWASVAKNETGKIRHMLRI